MCIRDSHHGDVQNPAEPPQSVAPSVVTVHLRCRNVHPVSYTHLDVYKRQIANGAANALAGKLGEHEVENDQVELMLLELLDSGLAVANAHDPVTLSLIHISTVALGCE